MAEAGTDASEGPSGASPARRDPGSLVRDGLGALAPAALSLVVVSLVVRFTVRDSVGWLAAFYFATPLVVCAAASAGAAVLAWRTGRRTTSRAGAVVAAVSASLYAFTSFVASAPAEPGPVRGLFWNLEHGRRGWSGVAAELTELDPDVAFLAETSVRDGDVHETVLRTSLPGRELVHAGGGLVAVVRGSARVLGFEKLPDRGCFAEFRVEMGGTAFDVVFADVGPRPESKRVPLARVKSAAERRLPRPVLVVGDFNTPRDSSEFDSWRGPLAHAFETAGSGLDATWPTPCPVLAIDHVWAGGGVKVRTAELPWTVASDHLPVVFTFDVE